MSFRYTLLIVLLLGNINVHAQRANPFLADAKGIPRIQVQTYTMEGSPYLTDEFIDANITLSSGRIYTGVKARINIVESQVEYLTDSGEELIATSYIKKLHFTAFPEKNGSVSALTLISPGKMLNDKEAIAYSVIDSGKVSLLKQITITFRDDRKYGESVLTRRFTKNESNYVLLPNGELKKFEKGKSFVLEVFSDKKDKVEEFISNKNVACKSIADFRQVLQFYNSL